MRRFVPRCAVSYILIGTGACLLLSGCGHAVSARGAGAAHGGDAGPCTVQELSRAPLIVDGGRALYVQPVVLEPNGRGETLLAGDISFLLERRSPDGRWTFVAEDSTFGAIIPGSGEPAVVPAPIPTRLIGGARALARGDGTWDVLFAQLHDYTGPSRPFTAERLWYGVLDGTRWTHLEPVPVPAGADTLLIANASALLRRGDTLFWAASLRRPGPDATVLYSRRGGRWRYDSIPTLGALYPRLAYADSLGLVLALVGPDRTLPSDANSLILWTRQPGWRPYRTLVPSSREQVHDPWISLAAGREVAGWVAGVEDEAGARVEAHAMAGPLGPAAPVMVLDSAVRAHGDFAVLPLEAAAGPRLWVLEHVLPGRERRELRIVGEGGGAPVLLAATAVSFPAGFRAAVPAAGHLLVAGAEYHAEQRMIVSVLLRFQVDCP